MPWETSPWCKSDSYSGYAFTACGKKVGVLPDLGDAADHLTPFFKPLKTCKLLNS